jgi:hypothetical protein
MIKDDKNLFQFFIFWASGGWKILTLKHSIQMQPALPLNGRHLMGKQALMYRDIINYR